MSTRLLAGKKISAVLKEHLVVFSLTFFEYASKMHLQSNINFFMTNFYDFLQQAGRKTTSEDQTNHNEGI